MMTSGEGLLLHSVFFVPLLRITYRFAHAPPPFSGGYMKSSARVIADSITNLSQKNLVQLGSQPD
uniref:Uncharacterized protein n=2 Tax=Aegilops tauschii TaxID=37682 RepID=A0A453SCC3_AEGTS